MSVHTRDVHGHKVYSEEDAKDGVNYLEYNIQIEECRVFFEQAKAKGSAPFEDGKGHNYTLLYKKDDTYWVYKRGADSSGWF
ncbi:MAG: hypothetical protein WCV69_02115 [Patescibacteria group bacterium]|jgi:hypothetical protein